MIQTFSRNRIFIKLTVALQRLRILMFVSTLQGIIIKFVCAKCMRRGDYTCSLMVPKHLIQSVCFLTLFLRRGEGGCSLVIFPNNFFGQPKVAKRLTVIYTNPITHLFTKMNRNLGVPYGQGESSKFSEEGGGLVKLHDSYFAYNKIFDKICL